MQECAKCILNGKYPNLSFNKQGECSLCSSKNTFNPIGEEKLINIFEIAKKNKKNQYDALVPLSGGKDSSYILHLAVNVYKLNVITMTYDNGLLSDIAIRNIKESIKKTNVKHVFYKPEDELQKKVFKYMLLYSGDICGACDIGTKASIIKIAKQYNVPLILYGTSPLEEDSFIPDSIQDTYRFKYILKKTGKFTKNEISSFLIFPNLNLFKISFWKATNIVGKEISPLFYINNPSDKDMGEIIKKELNWLDDDSKAYSKHFDCIAEPFTNYIRNKIYGYERHICQYSNMIRRKEIDKETALELYKNDNIDKLPANYEEILNILGLSKDDLKTILKNHPLKYEKQTSKLNKVYKMLMKMIKH